MQSQTKRLEYLEQQNLENIAEQRNLSAELGIKTEILATAVGILARLVSTVPGGAEAAAQLPRLLNALVDDIPPGEYLPEHKEEGREFIKQITAAMSPD